VAGKSEAFHATGFLRSAAGSGGGRAGGVGGASDVAARSTGGRADG